MNNVGQTLRLVKFLQNSQGESMNRLHLVFSGLVILLLVATVLGQVKKEPSPFDRYRQSAVNELAFRKLQFEVESLRQSLQPTPLPAGVGVPHIVGERADGKLVIEVEVHGSDLPQTLDARKYAMMEAVGTSLAAFSFAFDAPDSRILNNDLFNKWCVIGFSDTEKFFAKKKDNKTPTDPYVAFYENGELLLR